jgi:hypothetical protein
LLSLNPESLSISRLLFINLVTNSSISLKITLCSHSPFITCRRRSSLAVAVHHSQSPFITCRQRSPLSVTVHHSPSPRTTCRHRSLFAVLTRTHLKNLRPSSVSRTSHFRRYLSRGSILTL